MSKRYSYSPIDKKGLIMFSQLVDGYLTPMSRAGFATVVHWNPGINSLDSRVGRALHAAQWLVFSARADLRFLVSVVMSDYLAFEAWLTDVGPRAIRRMAERHDDLGYPRSGTERAVTPQIAALYDLGHYDIDRCLARRGARLHWRQRIGHYAWRPWPLANVELVEVAV